VCSVLLDFIARQPLVLVLHAQMTQTWISAMIPLLLADAQMTQNQTCAMISNLSPLSLADARTTLIQTCAMDWE